MATAETGATAHEGDVEVKGGCASVVSLKSYQGQKDVEERRTEEVKSWLACCDWFSSIGLPVPKCHKIKA